MRAVTLERRSEMYRPSLRLLMRSSSPSHKERLASLYNKPVEWFFGDEQQSQGFLAPPFTGASDSGTQPTPESSGVSLDERLRDFSARFDRLESAVRRMAIAEARPVYAASGDVYAEVRHVEVRQIAVEAGGGAMVWDETITGHLAFQRTWLDHNAIDPTQCLVITVRGESMEPTLPDGCSILVDRSQDGRRRGDGRIFVMLRDEGLVVNRVRRGDDGNWRIESEHPGWPPAPWSDTTEIICEVRWSAVTY